MADWKDTSRNAQQFGSVPRAGGDVVGGVSYDEGLRKHMLSIYNYLSSGVLLTAFVLGVSSVRASAQLEVRVDEIRREVRGAEPWVVPRYSGDWGEISEVETLRIAADRWLEPCKPEPGAVELFRMLPRAIAKHGGIYTGTSLIHAREGLGVIEEPWTDAWARRCIGAWRF
jgi:hypothetical protein